MTGPTSIKNLPIELLDIIFQNVANPCQQDHRGPGYLLKLPDIPYINMFPLNVAGVCTLWLRILKSHPQLWQRVLINVASNPIPFLDPLDLFKVRPTPKQDPDHLQSQCTPTLDLVVFSSDPSIDKYLEHSRARLVFKHLVTVIRRYSRIIFCLVYQSSLPSSTEILFLRASENLRELFLTCATYDLYDKDINDSDLIGVDDDTLLLGPSIPTYLNELSLTGFDFIRLCLAGILKREQQHEFRLSITHYKFRRHFTALMEFLRNMGHPDNGVHIFFSDISLEYWPSKAITSKYTVSVGKILFANISADFISAFFSSITFTNSQLDFISFQNCVIPYIGKWSGDIVVRENFDLRLVDIPYTGSETTKPSDAVLQLDLDHSLCNAIEAFPASDVRITRCKGVNDHFLRWLSGDDGAELEAHQMEKLKLYDCTNFTAKGAFNLLVNRHRRIQEKKHARNRSFKNLGYLEVFGKGPAINADDIPILAGKEMASFHEAYVSWDVERSDSHEPGCATDLLRLISGTTRYNGDISGVDLW